MKPLANCLGPFDRRVQRTRCLQCVRGHLKCSGCIPCSACRRLHRVCKLPESRTPIIRLEDAISFKSNALRKHSEQQMSLTPIYPVISDLNTNYMTFFAGSFLSYNSFTGSPVAEFDEVLLRLQSSMALHNVAIAISALTIFKRDVNGNTSSKSLALRHYRAAISSVRAEVAEGVSIQNITLLWSTLFMGLFELMYDSSGEGWLKHILHGTSQLLQFRGPEQHLTGPGRRFFLTMRIFEITRALIFWRPTLLAQEDWRALMGKMWIGEYASEWHPKEDLFDLMVSCSDVGIRTMHLIQRSEQSLELPNQTLLHQVASESMDLQAALRAWETMAHNWSTTSSSTDKIDHRMTLALIYFNATIIYVSGIFDYHHTYWTSLQIHIPILSPSEINERVNNILEMVNRALKETNLAAMSFLFPLRVAGARAKSTHHREEIARILAEIAHRGFAVAEAFSADLIELWRPSEHCADQSELTSGVVR